MNTAAPSLDLSRLEHVRTVGDKTTARCPACVENGGDDKGDHLFVSRDGPFGCIMHQGAEGDAHRKRIFELIGVQPARPAYRAKPKDDRVFAALEEAAKFYTPKGGTFQCVDEYPKDGKPFAAVARYQVPGDKTFRQFHATGAGWKLGGPVGTWPPFLVDALEDGKPIDHFEGEVKTRKAKAAGLNAASSAGGAKAAHKTDWSKYAGHEVRIGRDADKAGKDYAEAVAGRISALNPPARVKIVSLPYPAGSAKDIKDFLDEGHTADEYRALAEATPYWTPPPKAQPAPKAGIVPDGAESIRAELWRISQIPKITPLEVNRQSGVSVVAWLHKRGRFYFDVNRVEFSSVMFFDAERKLLLPVQSDAFLGWLANMLGVNRSERAFDFIKSACETEGLSRESTGIDPAKYWTSTIKAVYISAGPGRMARVDAESLEMVDNGTDDVLFPVGYTLKPWDFAEPVNPFESCALFQNMETTAPHGRDLFALWTSSRPLNQRTSPPLGLIGPIGSGKTRVGVGVDELFGLPVTISAVTKTGEGDFWTAMDAGGIAVFDNVDTRNDWFADAVSSAATGGCLSKRKLYTNSDSVTLKARAACLITSASPSFADDSGLADRMLVIRLERRTGSTAETALSDEIAANRNAGLTWICEMLASALADREPVPEGLNARHPDFAHMAVRLGRAMGREAEAVAALKAAESDKSLFCIENDWCGPALLDLTQTGPFTGTATELFDALAKIDPGLVQAEHPLTAKKLGKRLSKLWPHLEQLFHAKKMARSRDGHTVYTLSAASFASFGSLFSEKSPREENNRTLAKTASERMQRMQTETVDAQELPGF